jgi:hypothetical protein
MHHICKKTASAVTARVMAAATTPEPRASLVGTQGGVRSGEEPGSGVILLRKEEEW